MLSFSISALLSPLLCFSHTLCLSLFPPLSSILLCMSPALISLSRPASSPFLFYLLFVPPQSPSQCLTLTSSSSLQCSNIMTMINNDWCCLWQKIWTQTVLEHHWAGLQHTEDLHSRPRPTHAIHVWICVADIMIAFKYRINEILA